MMNDILGLGLCKFGEVHGVRAGLWKQKDPEIFLSQKDLTVVNLFGELA